MTDFGKEFRSLRLRNQQEQEAARQEQEAARQEQEAARQEQEAARREKEVEKVLVLGN